MPSFVAILAAGTVLFAATETVLARNGGHSGDRGAMTNGDRNRGMANADSHRSRDHGDKLSQKQASKEKTADKRPEKNKDTGQVAEKRKDKAGDKVAAEKSKDKAKTPVSTASKDTPAPGTGGTNTSAPAAGNSNPVPVVANHPLPGTGGTNTIHPIVSDHRLDANAGATARVNAPASAANKSSGTVTVDEAHSITVSGRGAALKAFAVLGVVEGAAVAPLAALNIAAVGFVKGGATGAYKALGSAASKVKEAFKLFF
jgi:hypothetical protein